MTRVSAINSKNAPLMKSRNTLQTVDCALVVYAKVTFLGTVRTG